MNQVTVKPLDELAILTAEMNGELRQQSTQLDESWPEQKRDVAAVLADDDDDAWLKQAKEKRGKVEMQRKDGLTRESLLRLSKKLKEIEAREGKLTLEGIINEGAEKASAEYQRQVEQSRWDYHVKQWKRRGGVGDPPPMRPLPTPPVRPEPEYAPEEHCHMPPFYGYGRPSPDGQLYVIWGKVDDEDFRVGVYADGACVLWLETSLRVAEGWVADTGFLVLKTHVSEDDVEFIFLEPDGSVFHRWQRRWRFLQFLRYDADGMGYAYYDDEGAHEVRFAID